MLMRFQGIPVRVHRWLLYLMVLFSFLAGRQPDGFSMAAVLGTASALLVLFAAVLLHELGHAFAARRLGVEVSDITLWPLGGMAVMRNMPEDPHVEMRIAFAGPLVNLAIGGFCLILWTGLQGELNWRAMLHTDVRNWGGFLSFTAVCHLMLGLFNLLPAFPMDGGKILRSILALRSDWLPATETAVRIGRSLAWVMVIAAFVYGVWSLLLIAIYLFLAGSRELWVTRMRHMIPGAGPMSDFLRNMGQPGGQDPDEPQEPGTPLGPASTGGFSEEDIERMESTRGPLRSADPDQEPSD